MDACFQDIVLQKTTLSAAHFASSGALKIAPIDTPLGQMIAVADHALRLLEFQERDRLAQEFQRLSRLAFFDFARNAILDQTQEILARYFNGDSADFTVPIAPLGTEFEHRVWGALREIPAGDIRRYGAVAASLEAPKASRAVGRANGANPITILIPCHRLVGANGQLTGYGGGLWRKKALLDHELRFWGQAA